MKSLIVAREREQAILSRLLEEPTAHFLTVYGRRIGKTFLIREYFDDSFAFKHTAISPLEFKDRPFCQTSELAFFSLPGAKTLVLHLALLF